MNALIIKARKAFVDSLKIKVRGGSGGNGLPQFGGIGGKGGDVRIQGTYFPVTLAQIAKKNPSRIFQAPNGFESRRTRLLGESGRDLTIRVPVGVTVEDLNKQVLGEINDSKDNVIVALGGRGGDKFNDNQGFKGQERVIRLEYKTISDVVFVGFPNAGKSSLLRAVSRASPKVASYPFTTLRPYIGVVQYPDYRSIRMADLPGLVEGAHKNIGLGHEFLKHMVHTRLLAFIIDINDVDLGPQYKMRSPLETLCILNKEIELYDDTILNKPAILAISKMDSLPNSTEKYEKLLKDLKSFQKDPKSSSLVEDAMKPNKAIQFEEILPISSVSSSNIDKFKTISRKVIDQYAELTKKEEDKISSFAEILPLQYNRVLQ